MKEIIPKDGKLACGRNWPALPFKCTRATPLLLARPPPGSNICVSMSRVSVEMRSIVWGVGDLHTQTDTTSNNQDVKPLHAHEVLALELDTTVCERVLALLANAAKFEAECDEVGEWVAKGACHPETGERRYIANKSNCFANKSNCCVE